MRLNINLASQPYEDARQFWLRWGIGLAVTAIASLALLSITITGYFTARRDHREIAELKHEIAKRDQDRMRAESFLNQPENRATRDQSQFLNQLIERKSLSWTQVLEDLEKVMPTRVHLISIRPEIDEDNQLRLKLVVGGDSRDRALDLVRKMEESHRFSQTYIDTETGAQQGTGDSVLFNIVGVYVPDTVPVAPEAPTAPKAQTAKRRAS
ncbi:MAG TPA: hypothetical protein VND65_20275 [Candidatus Binatia bacterium]|nr:hypothetical protein [Candidatus Binatia bacterium]